MFPAIGRAGSESDKENKLVEGPAWHAESRVERAPWEGRRMMLASCAFTSTSTPRARPRRRVLRCLRYGYLFTHMGTFSYCFMYRARRTFRCCVNVLKRSEFIFFVMKNSALPKLSIIIIIILFVYAWCVYMMYIYMPTGTLYTGTTKAPVPRTDIYIQVQPSLLWYLFENHSPTPLQIAD